MVERGNEYGFLNLKKDGHKEETLECKYSKGLRKQYSVGLKLVKSGRDSNGIQPHRRDRPQNGSGGSTRG